MNTPHERLIRTTFSLPFGEVHALVGGAVNARPLLFLHGFPDHPPTASRSSSTSPRPTAASRHCCAATPPLRSSVPSTSAPLPPTPAPLEYCRAIVRPLTTFVDRMRRAEAHIATPLLQLHGSDDGCIVPPTDEDRRLFGARVLEVVPNLGHFLHVEAPATIAARVARWFA